MFQDSQRNYSEVPLNEKRQAEYEKYRKAYQGVYGMGKARRLAAYDAIDRLEPKGSFLDVGCGRGDVMAYAVDKGFNPVIGIDVVPEAAGDLARLRLWRRFTGTV